MNDGQHNQQWGMKETICHMCMKHAPALQVAKIELSSCKSFLIYYTSSMFQPICLQRYQCLRGRFLRLALQCTDKTHRSCQMKAQGRKTATGLEAVRLAEHSHIDFFPAGCFCHIIPVLAADHPGAPRAVRCSLLSRWRLDSQAQVRCKAGKHWSTPLAITSVTAPDIVACPHLRSGRAPVQPHGRHIDKRQERWRATRVI